MSCDDNVDEENGLLEDVKPLDDDDDEDDDEDEDEEEEEEEEEEEYKKKKKKKKRKKQPQEREHLLFRPGYLWGLHAYVLRQSGARKLEQRLPINAPVDCFVSNTAMGGIHLKALALVKPIAFQNRDLKSDIEHSGMLRRGGGS